MRIPRTPLTTLIAAFLHFDTCFALWVLLGALGIFIAQSLKLSPAEQGFLVAVPTLGGSLARFPMGILGDRFGYKRVGTFLLLFLFLPLLAGWLLPLNFPALLAVGLLLGCAGSSFAVALPLASRCYPAERQGLVMGITAAGNMGTVIANLAAPALARSYGWQTVMGLAMIPLALILLAFVLLSREAEKGPAGVVSLSESEPESSGSVLASADLWWFCFFYSITFGGFVGLSTFLPLFLHNQYGLSAVNAGLLTALASLAGSLARPLGGVPGGPPGRHLYAQPRLLSCGRQLRPACLGSAAEPGDLSDPLFAGHARYGQRSGFPACSPALSPADWSGHWPCRSLWWSGGLSLALLVGGSQTTERQLRHGPGWPGLSGPCRPG
ncbi:nitrate/nitrite transporter [Thermogemmatispora sp.]|uniref:MFS transporter n=1 Tax=Thermogemmatispora sp. TaxID=1968838 RepID=UPI0035E457A6